MGITVTDREGRFRVVNPAFCELLGYDRRELRGRRYDDITHHEDRDKGRAAVAAMLAGRTSSVRLEKRYLRRDGKEVWVDLVTTLVHRRKGDPVFVAQVVDISSRQRAEQILVERESHYRSLYKYAWDYLFILRYDADGRPLIHDANDRACEMHGYAREELVGKPIDIVETEASHAMQHERVKLLQKPGDHAVFELEHRRKDGSVFPVEVSARVIQIAGFAPYVLAIGRDISERRDNERRIAEYTNQLQELTRLRERLLSVIGHDLRNPIGAIAGFADLLLAMPDEDPEQVRRYAGQIKRATGAALGLLTNLLEWARFQAGGIEAKPTVVELRESAAIAVAHVEASAGIKLVSIEVEAGPSVPVRADPAMLETVCRNLLSNAVKYSPPGETVSISFSRLPGKVACQVRDRGAGIPADRLENLFLPQTRRSTPGTAGEKGSGIGLLLCREFIERNGGIIRAENALDGGAVFTMELPSAE